MVTQEENDPYQLTDDSKLQEDHSPFTPFKQADHAIRHQSDAEDSPLKVNIQNSKKKKPNQTTTKKDKANKSYYKPKPQSNQKKQSVRNIIKVKEIPESIKISNTCTKPKDIQGNHNFSTPALQFWDSKSKYEEEKSYTNLQSTAYENSSLKCRRKFSKIEDSSSILKKDIIPSGNSTASQANQITD